MVVYRIDYRRRKMEKRSLDRKRRVPLSRGRRLTQYMCLEGGGIFKTRDLTPTCPVCGSREVSTLDNPRYPLSYIHL